MLPGSGIRAASCLRQCWALSADCCCQSRSRPGVAGHGIWSHKRSLAMLYVVSLVAAVLSLYLSAAVLQPGFYAASITPGSRAITAAAVCPHGFFCGGGLPVSSFDPSDPTALSATEPSIQRCPQGTLTQEPGATNATQCCKYGLGCSHRPQTTCHMSHVTCRMPGRREMLFCVSTTQALREA